jgi:hypothetical protein
MEPTKRFQSLAEVQRHKELLKARRASHQAGIKRHWETLGEPDFRSSVVNGAMRSLWKAWNPMDTLRTLAGQPSDLGGMLLGMALGTKARTGWGRLLMWVAGAVTPMVAERLQQHDRSQHLLSELGRSWERIKEYVRQRRAARQERSA